MRLIDADALKKAMDGYWGTCQRIRKPRNGETAVFLDVRATVEKQPTINAVPVVRCKDCKHRPVYDEQKREMPPMLNIEYDEDGEPWIWDDDMTCPYLCGDSYYNQMPDDEQFCDRGERKEE